LVIISSQRVTRHANVSIASGIINNNMCGRFVSKETKEKLGKRYHASKITSAPFTPSHNVAPTESVPIILEGEDNERSLELAAFGIPMNKDGRAFPLLNAQAESFSKWSHILTRRCIIPADGFYEWMKVSEKEKQPYYFSPKEGMFSFAGLWRPQASGFAFTILTTTPNEVVGPIHGRMPVILGHNAIPEWLSTFSTRETLQSLLEPYPAGLMQSWQVSKAVNSSKNKDAACINQVDRAH
jgi:putative SOS response-associated peptidase YedK